MSTKKMRDGHDALTRLAKSITEIGRVAAEQADTSARDGKAMIALAAIIAAGGGDEHVESAQDIVRVAAHISGSANITSELANKVAEAAEALASTSKHLAAFVDQVDQVDQA